MTVSPPPPATAGGGAAGPGFEYRLSVCEAFEESWQGIVDAHGPDWLGFRQTPAGGESSVILLHHPLLLVGVQIGVERGCQQNHGLVNG